MSKEIKEKILALVTDFFKGDLKKLNLWLSTPNYGLGGISPNVMMAVGRSKKLLKWVEQSLEENGPPE